MTVRIARGVRVVGTVQGVFFRAWTKQQADRLGVSGWVRNCADGSVAALLSGEPAAVEQMIALLHAGPPAARVDQVEVETAELDEGEGFAVRH